MEKIKLSAKEIEGLKARREQAIIAKMNLDNFMAGIAAAREVEGQFSIDEKTWELCPIQAEEKAA